MHRPLGNSTQQAHDRSLACCSWWYSAEFSFDEANTRAGDRDSGKSYGDFSRACRRAPSCELRSRRAPAALPTVADRPSSRGALSRMGASCSTQRPTSAPGLGAESSVSASMREGPVLTAGKAGKEEHWEDAESEVRSASGYAGHRATHEQRTTAVGLPPAPNRPQSLSLAQTSTHTARKAVQRDRRGAYPIKQPAHRILRHSLGARRRPCCCRLGYLRRHAPMPRHAERRVVRCRAHAAKVWRGFRRRGNPQHSMRRAFGARPRRRRITRACRAEGPLSCRAAYPRRRVSKPRSG